MKRILLPALFVSIASSAFCQVSKGSLLVGGNAGFTSNKLSSYFNDVKQTTFTISPDAGYFIFNNVALGLRASCSFGNTKSNNETYKNTGLALSPFLRYYFLPQKNIVNVFADASYDYTYYKTDVGSSSIKSKMRGFTIEAGPAIFLNPHVALELTLGYTYSKEKDFDQKTKSFLTNVGFQLHLGKIKKQKA